jgi:CRISPR system Cascade subunit CasB
MTQLDALPPATSAPSRRDVIRRLAHVLANAHFPRGDLAALRRLDPLLPTGTAYWRLLHEHVPDAYRRGADLERRWATILQGMAIMAPHHHGPDSPGQALARVGYSEQRLARLLNSRGEAFRLAVPRLCRYLTSRGGQAVDWTRLGALILAEGRDRERAEQLRLDLARDYFAAIDRAQATAPDSTVTDRGEAYP